MVERREGRVHLTEFLHYRLGLSGRPKRGDLTPIVLEPLGKISGERKRAARYRSVVNPDVAIAALREAPNTVTLFQGIVVDG